MTLPFSKVAAEQTEIPSYRTLDLHQASTAGSPVPHANEIILPDLVLTPANKRKIADWVRSLPKDSAARLLQTNQAAAQSSTYHAIAEARNDKIRLLANAALFADWRHRLEEASAADAARISGGVEALRQTVIADRVEVSGEQAALHQAERVAPVQKRRIKIRHHRHYKYTVMRSKTPEIAAARARLDAKIEKTAVAQARFEAAADALAEVRAEPASLNSISKMIASQISSDDRLTIQRVINGPAPDERQASTLLAKFGASGFVDKTGVRHSLEAADARAFVTLDQASRQVENDKAIFYAAYKPNLSRPAPPRSTVFVEPVDASPQHIKASTTQALELTTLCKWEGGGILDLRQQPTLNGISSCAAVFVNRVATGHWDFDALLKSSSEFEAIAVHGLPTPSRDPQAIAAVMSVLNGNLPDPTYGGATFFQNPCVTRQRGTDFGASYTKVGTVGDPRSCNFHALYNGIGGRIYKVPEWTVTVVNDRSSGRIAQSVSDERVLKLAQRPAAKQVQVASAGPSYN